MPRLLPQHPDAQRVDAALAEWRQGDATLDAGWFVHVADGTFALTDAAAEAGEGTKIVQASSEGTVVLTQTCDLVRSCVTRPFVEVSPLVEVPENIAHEIERGYRPNYAIVPALRGRRLVADLDRVMTVEKSIVAMWTRISGCMSDDDARKFGHALARKRVRFAFPDDFNALVKKLQARIEAKHDKHSDDGRALRALREIRVNASPSWEHLEGVDVFFWFVPNDGETTFEGKSWDSFVQTWTDLVPAHGRFKKVEGVSSTLSGMSAQDYVDSDPLDLDYLSTRDS